MEKTMINIRVNKEEKKQAEKVLENLGVSMSTAINMYIIQIAKQKKIPFEIKEETYEDKVKIMIEKAKSKNLIKTYDEFLNTKESEIYTINEDPINYKKSNNKSDITDIEFDNLVKELDEKGEIKSYEDFLKTQDAIDYSISEESANYYWQTSNNYSIGDIIFVSDFIFKSGKEGSDHLFVIVSEKEAVDITFFGFILSSNLKKSTYPYNIFLKKTKENHLDKDSIVKCDDLIKIDKKKIKLKIGKVTYQELKMFKEAYKKYKSKE